MKTKLFLMLLSIIPLFTFAQNTTNYGDGSGTGGNYSSYFGKNAGIISIEDNNTFIGSNSGENNTTGSSNTFLGTNSGRYNTIGIKNTFIGTVSGRQNSQGNQNTFVGYAAGLWNETGNNNIYLGHLAGYTKKSGDRNIFLGFAAGRYDSVGVENIFVGEYSGEKNKTGIKNIFFGSYSGKSNNNGSHNVYLGHRSGWNNISGSHNIFLGHKAGYNETGSNKLYIENSTSATPLIYGEFDQDKVGINTTNLVGDYSLFVRDGIITEKVVVEVEGEWPDYVFNPTYQLPSLKEVSNYIKTHKHLPEIPSAKEIEKDGLNLGEMEALMMKKIEELTLYAIEQEREKEALKGEVQELKVEKEKLEIRMGQMEREKDELKKRLEKLEAMIVTLINK